MTCPSTFALAVAMATELEQAQRKPTASTVVVGPPTDPAATESGAGQLSIRKRGIWLWAALAAICIASFATVLIAMAPVPVGVLIASVFTSN